MTKRPPITTRTNIGWTCTYLPGKLNRVVCHPDVIATPSKLESRVYACKLKLGLGGYGVAYVQDCYRKLDGKWVRLTVSERECLQRVFDLSLGDMT